MAANTSDKKVCYICKFSDTNNLDYGEWKTSEGCTIHYYCALLSTNARQNGEDHEGIEGFLVRDIKNLVSLHTKTKCYYCRKRNASIHCGAPKCSRYFHLVCGIKNNCLNQFDGQFSSFCHRHVDIQEKYEIHGDFWHCQICKETIGEYNAITSIPSCCNQGYYHKKCMQNYTISAGLLTKCPSCGNDNGYQKFLKQRGVFVPHKDANWELLSNAYGSLLYVHNKCDAGECLCPNGRFHKQNRGDWFLHRCHFCGGIGSHAKCRIDDTTKPFGCRECTEKCSVLITAQSQSSNNNNENSESVSDSNGNDVELRGQKRKPTHEFDEEGKGKVCKEVQTNKEDPLSDQNQKDMQNRLNLFFDRADFHSKPPPRPWLD